MPTTAFTYNIIRISASIKAVQFVTIVQNTSTFIMIHAFISISIYTQDLCIYVYHDIHKLNANVNNCGVLYAKLAYTAFR